MLQIEVKVKHKESQEDRIITYKSFLDTQVYWELIGQVNENGELIPGDPNLQPRHQKVQANDVAVHADNPGKPNIIVKSKVKTVKEEIA